MKKNTKKPEAVSAGGIIIRHVDSDIELLLIRDKRYTAWVVPKGHVEKDETLEQAAIREVNEEAGVTEATIIKKLGQFHRYVTRASEWKTIHYFLMHTAKEQPLGKPEDTHMETKWFPIIQLPEMYLSEQEQVIKENLDIILQIKKFHPKVRINHVAE